MKIWIWIIVGVAIFGGLAAWFAISQKGVAVDAVEVTQGPIREFVDERGKTRLPQTYLITMPAAGRVQGIGLTAGTKVKKGQVVAQMVPLDLKLAVDESEASVRRLQASIRENAATNVEETALSQAKHFVKSMHDTVAAAATRVLAGKAKLDYAEKHFGRVATLAKTGAQTQDELDQAILERVSSSVAYREDELIHMAVVAMAAATDLLPTMIEQQIANKGLSAAVLKEEEAAAEARLKQVHEDQRRGTVVSPVDGVVLQRIVDDEQFLAAGTSLMEIGRLQDMDIEADILSLDVVDLKIGNAVEIYGPTVGKSKAKGTVAKIYPAGFTKVSSLGVEQQRVKVIIRFDEGELDRLLADRHLGVGYRVRVRIITAEKNSVAIVPRSALFRGSGSQWQLFAVRDGRASIQDVTIGLMNDRVAEVVEGLEPGDTVIVAPETSLADEAKVSPQTQ